MSSRPEVKRSLSHRDLARQREFLLKCGSREELKRYLMDQIRRFTVIENCDNYLSTVAHRDYILSHTRSPNLQRKKQSQSSVDTTIRQLINYSEIQPDENIRQLFEELWTVLAPICDNEQLRNLQMIGEKIGERSENTDSKLKRTRKARSKHSKEKEVTEQRRQQQALLQSAGELLPEISEVDRLLTHHGRLRKDAELIVAKLLPQWLDQESAETFLREDSDMRRVLRVFLKHLTMQKQKHFTAEGFLMAISEFTERLVSFLQKVQTLAEERNLESPEQRGHKLVLTIVHMHFIPQLPDKDKSAAARSLVHHRETNSDAFQRAVAIFTWN